MTPTPRNARQRPRGERRAGKAPWKHSRGGGEGGKVGVGLGKEKGRIRDAAGLFVLEDPLHFLLFSESLLQEEMKEIPGTDKTIIGRSILERRTAI